MQTVAIICAVLLVVLGLVIARPYLKGNRTRIFNVAAATFAAIATFDLSFLPPHWTGPLLLGAALGNLWLRELTDTPAGRG